MASIVLLLSSLVGIVTAEAGLKGYSPKYNLKTYGNAFGPGYFGVNGYHGIDGFQQRGLLFGAYGSVPEYGSYGNSYYGLNIPSYLGGIGGYESFRGFPVNGYYNGRNFAGINNYRSYGVYGKGIGPFNWYGLSGFDGRLGGNLEYGGYRGYGVSNGYGPYGFGGFINGQYGYKGYGSLGKLGKSAY